MNPDSSPMTRVFMTPQRGINTRRGETPLRSSLQRQQFRAQYYNTPPVDENSPYDSTDTMSIGSSASSAKFQALYQQQLRSSQLKHHYTPSPGALNSPFIDRSNQPGTWDAPISERQYAKSDGLFPKTRSYNSSARVGNIPQHQGLRVNKSALENLSGSLNEMRQVREAANNLKSQVLGIYSEGRKPMAGRRTQHMSLPRKFNMEEALKFQAAQEQAERANMSSLNLETGSKQRHGTAAILGAAKRFVNRKSNDPCEDAIDEGGAEEDCEEEHNVTPLRETIRSDYSVEEKEGDSDSKSETSDCVYSENAGARRYPPDSWIEREKREFEEELCKMMNQGSIMEELLEDSPSSAETSFKSENGRLNFEDLAEECSPKKETPKVEAEEEEEEDETEEYSQWIKKEQEQLRIRLAQHSKNLDYLQRKELEEQMSKLKGHEAKEESQPKRSAWSLESAISSRREIQKAVSGATPVVTAGLPTAAKQDDQELMVQLAKRFQSEMKEKSREIQELREMNERVLHQQRIKAKRNQRRQSFARLPTPRGIYSVLKKTLRRKSSFFSR